MRITFTFFLIGFFVSAQGQAPGSLGHSGNTGMASGDLQAGLTGCVTGLNIQSVTTADTTARYRTRCLRTVNDNLQPLLLVDGQVRPLSTLSELNPNDIACVEVLKSAPATAIFGPEGVPGAILINTKKPIAAIKLIILDSADRQPVARASVEVVDEMTRDTLRRMADDSGRIVFPGGTLYRKYEIQATATGYQQAKINLTLLRQSGDSTDRPLFMSRKVKSCPEVVVTCFDCTRVIRCGSWVRVTKAVPPVAEPEKASVAALVLFPNPVARGRDFQFSCPDLREPATLQLWSLGGQLVAAFPVPQSKSGNPVRISTDQRWASGSYVMRLCEKGRVVASGKIILQ